MRDETFKRMIMRYYRRHGRHDLPWRKTVDPYAILVSEIMLQQTQVPRVIEKFREFLTAFPAFRRLAQAPTSRVLKVWQGLGYNRRALMLQRCARMVVQEYGGRLPQTHAALCTLPGIGPYTAGAILAFAFDGAHPVIETNIRRVYLHHWFSGRSAVADAEILPLVARHVASVRSPRAWYSALMDYGTHLATQVENPNQRSRHHVRQSKFEGSVRQVRGQVLRTLLARGAMTERMLQRLCSDERVPQVVAALIREGMVVHRRGRIACA